MRDLSIPIFSRRACLAGGALALISGIGAAGCTGGDATDSARSGSAEQGAAVTMRIGALRGPTGMGLVGLMDAAGALSADDAGPLVGTDPAGIGELTATYEFQLAGSADELAPQLIQGDLDALCVPANLAATLYQKTEGAVTVLAVNTLGVLDIVETGESISGIGDLAGRTIVSAGRGTTPEYALAYLLEQNGVVPASIEWKSEHAECLAALEADPTLVAMLPQPFATSALARVDGARIALDLSAVWDETAAASGSDSQLVTGVIVARSAFCDEHADTVRELMDAYGRSVSFVNEDRAAAAQLIEAAGIIDASVAEQAIPYCNIVFVTGADMRSALEGYLQTLFDADPSTVGGQMPGDAFYFDGYDA